MLPAAAVAGRFYQVADASLPDRLTTAHYFRKLWFQITRIAIRGYVRRVIFNGAGYTVNDIRALGQPEQQATTYEYYADNLLKSATDPLGNKTSYDFDANGNCTRATLLDGTPQAATTTATYASPYSGVASVTDPLNHTATFTYDASGNLTAATDPLGHQTTMAYNSAGQVTTLTDGVGNSTQLDYFGGDLTSTTDPLSNKTSRVVDGAGRLVSITDAIGQVTSSQYDNLDQMLKTTDPAGHVVSFAYDPNGNLLSVTDPKNGITSYTYDGMDRRTTRTDPLQRVESVQRDLFGNVLSRTDRKGQVTAYSYDSLNRVTFAGFNKVVNGGATTYESTISYTYDGGDRLTQATDSASGAISYAYDGLGRPLTETTPQGTLSYTYDLAGRRIKRSLAGQPDVTYAWDDATRLTQITQGASSVGFTYDDANRRSVLTLPNGVTATYTYDTDSRLTGLNYQLGSNSLGTLNYTYDAVGRRTQVSGTLARTEFPSTLTSATYDTANELTNWNGTAITYDANGNMTSDGSRAFTWNARNQLSGIGGGASFQYDAVSRRTNKTVSGGATNFLYEGVNSIQENSGAANILTGGVDEFFQRTDSSGSMTPLTDALGSVLALVDSSGTVQIQYSYEPFGNTSTSGASSSSATQYTGRENDGTGLYFYRARYHNPAFQRFISEDPMGLSGGDVNFYAYTGNDPIDNFDPTGTDKTKKLACSADAALNFGLGFVPGYNAVKFVGDLAGVNFHPFEWYFSDRAGVTADPTLFQAGAGLADAYRTFFADPAYAAAGGESALNRLSNLAMRSGFGRQSASTQANILRRLGDLETLEQAVSSAGTIANLLNAASFAYDVYNCWQ